MEAMAIKKQNWADLKGKEKDSGYE